MRFHISIWIIPRYNIGKNIILRISGRVNHDKQKWNILSLMIIHLCSRERWINTWKWCKLLRKMHKFQMELMSYLRIQTHTWLGLLMSLNKCQISAKSENTWIFTPMTILSNRGNLRRQNIPQYKYSILGIERNKYLSK